MNAISLLKMIPITYSDQQIEASLIKAFLQQKCLESAALNSLLQEAVCSSVPELCNLILSKSDGGLTLKQIENVFEALIDDQEKRENGIIFTPCYIVDYIIQNTIDDNINTQSRIIDPACGSGSFLVLAAEQLSTCLNKSVRDVIAENIYGIDIGKDNIRRTKELLSLLVLSKGEKLEQLTFNIVEANSLKSNWLELFEVSSFDYIIGNPPYVNTHDMSKETVSHLKASFKTTKKGVFNIFYAFIEQSMKFLSDNGKLGFIIPNNYLTITAAKDIRQYLVENAFLHKIIDFGENMVFYPVRTYNSLLFLNKSKNQTLLYATIGKTECIKKALFSATMLSMPIADLDSAGWILLSESELRNIKKIEQAGKPIKPFIRVGIATLKDNIYILDGFDETQGLYFKDYEKVRYYIEPEITRGIYKVSNIKAESSIVEAKQHIIFPYDESTQEGLFDASKSYQIISEDIVAESFPLCYHYLCQVRDILDGRDKGKGNSVAWYAYGRSQGLGNNKRKLLFPTFSLHPKFILEEDRETLFCNGYAILEPEEYTLEFLQKILNSIIMDYYIAHTSYALEGNYKCYQKKYIQNFSIPHFTEDEKQYLIGETDTSKINQFLISKYDLNLCVDKYK